MNSINPGEGWGAVWNGTLRLEIAFEMGMRPPPPSVSNEHQSDEICGLNKGYSLDEGKFHPNRGCLLGTGQSETGDGVRLDFV